MPKRLCPTLLGCAVALGCSRAHRLKCLLQTLACIGGSKALPSEDTGCTSLQPELSSSFQRPQRGPLLVSEPGCQGGAPHFALFIESCPAVDPGNTLTREMRDCLEPVGQTQALSHAVTLQGLWLWSHSARHPPSPVATQGLCSLGFVTKLLQANSDLTVLEVLLSVAFMKHWFSVM